MLRRVTVSLAVSILLLAPACKKKGDAADDKQKQAADAKQAAATKDAPPTPQPTPQPTPTPDPVESASSGAAGSGSGGGSGIGASGGFGGSGGAAKVDREDLTCDPLDKAGCLEGEQCIGAQGCDAVWSCDDEIVCRKGVTEFCGCDGRTFEAVFGNCPWQKYAYEGPCK